METKMLHADDLVLPKERRRIGEVFELIKDIDTTSMDPIIIDSNNIILDGKKRYLACIYRGVEMIPVIVRNRPSKINFDFNSGKPQ